jgi:murein DD-endopeptidase MepM/ murein hydrolase activator NlpD
MTLNLTAFFTLFFWLIGHHPSSNTAVKAEQRAYKLDYVTDGFDYPVGKPDGEGYYNAQKFGANDHLGDDFNAVTGGNTDLGDPVYVTANGVVTFADDVKGGWGNVIRVLHQLPDGTFVESLYGHCDTVLVKKDQWLKKGDQIGTIGTAHGIYTAHLHFEIRTNIKMLIGPGYSRDKTGYTDPTAFIEANR